MGVLPKGVCQRVGTLPRETAKGCVSCKWCIAHVPMDGTIVAVPVPRGFAKRWVICQVGARVECQGSLPRDGHCTK